MRLSTATAMAASSCRPDKLRARNLATTLPLPGELEGDRVPEPATRSGQDGMLDLGRLISVRIA